ncbi:hypothetical protein RN001_011928 [Aquatica leii]|uniref:Major facilitator superfamily (MFS) profile domain-containing protein n=1 Tax=Aquatica leii TaxID=1421715 RepID=A0AAN7S7K9_9COLE|nr:hypothetical protein RN001_011928 [Aquatica leii]
MSVRYGAVETAYIPNNDDEYIFEEHFRENSEKIEPTFHERTWWDVVVESFLIVYLLITAANNGMIMGYSAVLLPQLKAVNGSLHIDDEMGSWIASINSASIPVGALLSGIFMNYCGRKGALLIYAAMVALGWVFILSAHNCTVVLIGRFIGGIATSLGMVPGQVYIAEIAHQKKRGSYGSISFIGLSFGILLVYILGSVLQWRIVAGLSIILPIVSAVMLLYLPESPVWYIRKGKIDKAMKACLWFRRNYDEAEEEIDELINRVNREKIEREISTQSTLSILCSRQVIKPFIIMNTFIMFQSLSGVYLFVFYAVEIIDKIGDIGFNNFFVSVVTAAVRLLFTIIATILFAFVGRRPMALISLIGTFVAAFVLGTTLYFAENPNSYVLATCLLCYISANTIGLLILPGMMLGEIFPAKVRALSGSISFSMFSLFNFVFAKMYPLLIQYLRFYGLFWFFGASAFLGTIYIYVALPETKGKTLHEIEDYFMANNLFWITRNKSSKETQRLLS